MRCIGALAGLAVLFAGTAFSQDEAAKKELDRLQGKGKWKMVEVKAADQIEIEFGKFTTMQIQGDKVVWTIDVPGSKEGKQETTFKIKVDPTKKAKDDGLHAIGPQGEGQDTTDDI